MEVEVEVEVEVVEKGRITDHTYVDANTTPPTGSKKGIKKNTSILYKLASENSPGSLTRA